MIKPISPKEVVNKKNKEIPDFVIESFNELITKNFHNDSSIVKQKDVVKLILKKDKKIKRTDIFDNNWLDVENVYEEQGWCVRYEKIPVSYENYESMFVFSIKSEWL